MYHDLTCRKEMWVFENQFHPLWELDNVGGLDCHQYVMDWLKRALIDGETSAGRVAYAATEGDGPFGACEWQLPVEPGQAYF